VPQRRVQRDASMPVERAKQELREWAATVSGISLRHQLTTGCKSWRGPVPQPKGTPPRTARHNAMASMGPLVVRLHRSGFREIHGVGEDGQHHHGLWVIRITPEARAVKGRRARTVPLPEQRTWSEIRVEPGMRLPFSSL